MLCPVLFTLYSNNLLMNLKSLGVGWYREPNGLLTGAVCYTDNLAVLAPSPSALIIIIFCCEDFDGCHALPFNASKTQLIHFSHSQSYNCHACTFFCGQLPPFVNSITHLGHNLSYNLSDAPDSTCKLQDMVGKANYVLVRFRFNHTFSLSWSSPTVLSLMVPVCSPSLAQHFLVLRLLLPTSCTNCDVCLGLFTLVWHNLLPT